MWSHNYTFLKLGNISKDVEFGWVPVFFLFIFFRPRQEVNVNITVLALFVVGMWRERSNLQ